jgi:hypothetical protein
MRQGNETMKTKLRLKVSRISPRLNRVQRNLQPIAKKAYDFFKKETPIRSGNARRKTRLQGQTIKADYPYAKRLDNGWSKQAPEGMSDPTINYIQGIVKQVFRGR